MNRIDRRKRSRELKKIAQRIRNLEEMIRLGKNVKSNQDEIQKIMNTLSIEDMLEIDEYIMSKTLTK